MSLSDALAAGRRAAEALMTSRCRITRAGAAGTTFDPVTGTYTEPADVVVYDDVDAPGAGAPCRVQTRAAAARDIDTAGGELVEQDAVVSIPIAATGARVGDVVTITAVGADDDPDLDGAVYRVAATHRKSHATARRLGCEEITG